MLPTYAERVVPVLQPQRSAGGGEDRGAPEDQPRLDDGSTSPTTAIDHDAGIGCPYVAGPRPQDAAGRLPRTTCARAGSATCPIRPTSDTETPLLYRLARLSLTRNIATPIVEPTALSRRQLQGSTADRPSDVLERRSGCSCAARDRRCTAPLGGASCRRIAAVRPGSTAAGIQVLRRLNAAFADALRNSSASRRGREGVAELEMLLFEVIDLFQHRVDAWATGLAYARLASSAKQRPAGLRRRLLRLPRQAAPNSRHRARPTDTSRPRAWRRRRRPRSCGRPICATSRTAPSPSICLARVRRALALLDVLKKGLALEEALGLRGERWLHDSKLSRLTLELRLLFPREQTPPGAETATARPTPQASGRARVRRPDASSPAT